MFNPISYMRQASIFGRKRFPTLPEAGRTPPFVDPRDPGPSPTTPYDSAIKADVAPDDQDDPARYYSELERIRTNRGPALTAYQEALKGVPQREQYKPSIKRRLLGAAAGALSGFGNPALGVQTAQGVVNAPYERAVTDYNNRIGGLRESAGLEREEVEGQIKTLMEAKAMGLKYDEFKLKQLQEQRAGMLAESRIKTDQGNLDVNKQNANSTAARTSAYGKDIDSQIGNRNRTAGQKDTELKISDANQKSLAAYRQGQLAIGRKNADANMKRADGSNASPNEQAKAIDIGLRQLATDPRFSKYIEQGELPNDVYKMKINDGSPMYAEFMKELRKIAEKSAREGTPFVDDMGDGADDEFLIEPGRP